MRTKRSYTKYIVFALITVILITAALMLLEFWEKNQGRFGSSDEENSVLTYEGKEYVLKNKVDTFLVLGLDKFEGQTSADSHKSGIQADFLMLYVFDNETKQCSAIHINRDTMTSINKLGIGGAKVDTLEKQIALAYNYVADSNQKVKCRNTKDAVEGLLMNIDIKHYVSFTMDAVPVLNDLVDGVEVTVLDDFTAVDDNLKKGEKVTLQGSQALTYVRSRYGLEDSSNLARMARQQQYITALLEKVASRAEDEEFAITLADTIDEYVVYDASDQKMKSFAERFKEYEFLGIRELEGETITNGELVEFYPDEASVKEIVIDLLYTERTADK